MNSKGGLLIEEEYVINLNYKLKKDDEYLIKEMHKSIKKKEGLRIIH